MERRSSETRSIGKFRITPSEIETLAKFIEAEAGERKLRLDSIEVNTKNSVWTYKTVEEMQADRVWDKEILKFELMFRETANDQGFGSRSTRTIHIQGGQGLDNRIFLYGDVEGWVVGTAEIVQRKMKRYEVWYKHLVKEWLVRVAYPILASMLALAFIWSKWIFFRSGESESIGLSLLLWIVLSGLFTWLSYKLPIRSRIVEETSKKANTYRWTVFGAILGLIGLLAHFLL